MSMTEGDKRKKVERLRIAHEWITKNVLGSQTIVQDMHSDASIAQNWTTITTGYSGFEQTLKYLIAEQEGQDVTKRNNRPQYPTHDVSELFLKLEKSTKRHIQEYYARLQSLHSYVEIETVEEFLESISPEGGRGYELWRYALIEKTLPPKNSPEVLIALWGACIQIAIWNLYKNERLQMPEEALESEIRRRFKCTLKLVLERCGKLDQLVDITNEGERWFCKHDHPLNACAKVLQSLKEYGEHGETNVSTLLSETLTEWATNITNDPSKIRLTSFGVFIRHAAGLTTCGQSIRWNSISNRFENTGWSLKNPETSTGTYKIDTYKIVGLTEP